MSDYLSPRRAIFAKVKECRKMVEHHPKLGSCSPSFVDPELDESRASRGRFRSLRRYSGSRSRRTDSFITARPSGSPQNNKANTMSYLRVPPAASTNAVEIKGESLLEKQEGIGKNKLSFLSCLKYNYVRFGINSSLHPTGRNVKGLIRD